MQLAASHGVVLRFAAGTLGSFLAGLIAFRGEVFDVTNPAFQCLPLGALGAAILALSRASRPGIALQLVAAFALVQFGATWQAGWFRATAQAAWSVAIGLGLWLVAAIYDQLARLHVRLGKFLVVGPLLGGVFFATTPLASLAAGEPDGVLRSLWWNAFLGIVLGDGLGAAVELVELFILPGRPAAAEIGDDGIEQHHS